ncbi:arginine repressor [Streptococcus pneumoniae]|nr:arginine repressor [Streptococcus pneumoniae]
MNKSEHRHQLIRALITKNKIHTQAELQALLAENDIQVTQATLSRDIKNMNLSKVREEDSAYYVLNNGSISKWENVSNSTWKTPLSGCAQFNTKSY